MPGWVIVLGLVGLFLLGSLVAGMAIGRLLRDRQP